MQFSAAHICLVNEPPNEKSRNLVANWDFGLGSNLGVEDITSEISGIKTALNAGDGVSYRGFGTLRPSILELGPTLLSSQSLKLEVAIT